MEVSQKEMEAIRQFVENNIYYTGDFAEGTFSGFFKIKLKYQIKKKYIRWDTKQKHLKYALPYDLRKIYPRNKDILANKKDFVLYESEVFIMQDELDHKELKELIVDIAIEMIREDIEKGKSIWEIVVPCTTCDECNGHIIGEEISILENIVIE